MSLTDGQEADLLTFFFRHGGEIEVDYDMGAWAVTTRSARVRPPVCASGPTLGDALEALIVRLRLRGAKPTSHRGQGRNE